MNAYVTPSLRRCVMPEPIDCDNIIDTCLWASAYASDADQHPHLRFTIGVYQIDSMLRAFGRSEHEFAEAAAAFVIHTAGAAMICAPNACLLTHTDACDWVLEREVVRWSQISHHAQLDAAYMLANIARLQRQYCYILTTPVGSVRRARINRDVIQSATAGVVYEAMSVVPPLLRAEGMETAMQMLLDCEWRR